MTFRGICRQLQVWCGRKPQRVRANVSGASLPRSSARISRYPALELRRARAMRRQRLERIWAMRPPLTMGPLVSQRREETAPRRSAWRWLKKLRAPGRCLRWTVPLRAHVRVPVGALTLGEILVLWPAPVEIVPCLGPCPNPEARAYGQGPRDKHAGRDTMFAWLIDLADGVHIVPIRLAALLTVRNSDVDMASRRWTVPASILCAGRP